MMTNRPTTRKPFAVINPNIPQNREQSCSARKERMGGYQQVTPPPKPMLPRLSSGGVTPPPKDMFYTPPTRGSDEEQSSPAESTPAPPSETSDSPTGCRLGYSPVGRSEIECQKFLLPPQSDRHSGKLTVVFDLDETLVSNRRPGLSSATPRHYLMHMFHILRELAEIVLWTASTEETGKHVLHQIDPKGEFFHHIIYRNSDWFTEGTHTKDLTLLGRSMDKVIIVENTPNCCKFNQQNAIMVEDFTGDLMYVFIPYHYYGLYTKN